jgi:type III secretory pathway component EscU
VEKVVALLLVLVSFLAVVVLVGYADYVVQVLKGLAQAVEAMSPAPLTGAFRFQRVGEALDKLLSSWLAPIAGVVVVLIVFAWLAHEKRR